MTTPLANLRPLRDEMAARGWVITCFPFRYKNKDYFVLPQRYVPEDTVPKYQLMELTFVDRTNPARTLTAPANSSGIDIGAKALREYFGIEWAPNLGDLLAQFAEVLGRSISGSLPVTLSAEERTAAMRQLDKSSEDPGKLYCQGTRRNPLRVDGTQGRRSDFNSQKTELLRPELFARLRHDSNISFRYSDNPDDEQTDDQILARFQ